LEGLNDDLLIHCSVAAGGPSPVPRLHPAFDLHIPYQQNGDCSTIGTGEKGTMHTRAGLLTLLLALGFLRTANAQDVESRVRTARMACLSGDHEKGLALLSALFVETRNSTHVYNQGRCFEQNHRWEDAMARFQEYLRISKNLTASEKAETDEHIAECQAQLAKQTATPAATAAAALPSTPPVPTVTRMAEPPASASGSGLRTAGIVTASAGVALLASGLVLNWKANSLTRDLKKLDGYSPGKASDRDTYVAWGWVGYSAGAACLAVGAALTYFGFHAGAPQSLAFIPAAGPGQVGALLSGAF
jgi:hypothetical protein